MISSIDIVTLISLFYPHLLALCYPGFSSHTTSAASGQRTYKVVCLNSQSTWGSRQKRRSPLLYPVGTSRAMDAGAERTSAWATRRALVGHVARRSRLRGRAWILLPQACERWHLGPAMIHWTINGMAGISARSLVSVSSAHFSLICFFVFWHLFGHSRYTVCETFQRSGSHEPETEGHIWQVFVNIPTWDRRQVGTNGRLLGSWSEGSKPLRRAWG